MKLKYERRLLKLVGCMWRCSASAEPHFEPHCGATSRILQLHKKKFEDFPNPCPPIASIHSSSAPLSAHSPQSWSSPICTSNPFPIAPILPPQSQFANNPKQPLRASPNLRHRRLRHRQRRLDPRSLPHLRETHRRRPGRCPRKRRGPHLGH